MNKQIHGGILMIALWFCISGAMAHDRFILPSHTVLSGKAQSVSLLASVSNDPFHADRPFGDNGKGVVPKRLQTFFDSLDAAVIGPDGKATHQNIWQAFGRFSAADIILAQSGTYRVCLIQPPTLMTTFRKADGSHGRAFGDNPVVPEGSEDIRRLMVSSRVETFVTLNESSRDAVKPEGRGLELIGETHPNDLFAGETASWQLFLDGKPLKHVTDVSVVRGSVRHRNDRQPIVVQTDESGHFRLAFPEAGFYLLKANISVPGEPGSNIDVHRASLFVTLEVFPQ